MRPEPAGGVVSLWSKAVLSRRRRRGSTLTGRCGRVVPVDVRGRRPGERLSSVGRARGRRSRRGGRSAEALAPVTPPGGPAARCGDRGGSHGASWRARTCVSWPPRGPSPSPPSHCSSSSLRRCAPSIWACTSSSSPRSPHHTRSSSRGWTSVNGSGHRPAERVRSRLANQPPRGSRSSSPDPPRASPLDVRRGLALASISRKTPPPVRPAFLP